MRNNTEFFFLSVLRTESCLEIQRPGAQGCGCSRDALPVMPPPVAFVSGSLQKRNRVTGSPCLGPGVEASGAAGRQVAGGRRQAAGGRRRAVPPGPAPCRGGSTCSREAPGRLREPGEPSSSNCPEEILFKVLAFVNLSPTPCSAQAGLKLC